MMTVKIMINININILRDLATNLARHLKPEIK